MSSLTVLLLCVQAFLVQNVFSQCLGPAGPIMYGPPVTTAVPIAAGIPYDVPVPIAPVAIPYDVVPVAVEVPAIGLGGYGGSGVGDVAVVGEMPVAGTTIVAGQVPILGAVSFAGDLPAAGTVTITGSCGCGPVITPM